MFDLWRSGYVRRPQAEVVQTTGPAEDEVIWLPSGGPFQYFADPFPLERDGLVTVFVEAFDYRTRRGEIRYFQYDAHDNFVAEGEALAEPWHLSYPQIIEEDGQLYMLPEGHKSGGLTLYRCVSLPDRWEPVSRLLDVPAIDATVIRHADRWWMFHALPGPDDRAMRELHVAWAETLTGPWTPHAANPVMTGFLHSRPGGTAQSVDGSVILPVQDCGEAYGVAINLLRIGALTPEAFEAEVIGRIEPEDRLFGFSDGLHTLSGHGGITCIDVKSVRRSPQEGWVRAEYKVRRLLGLNGPRRARGSARRWRPSTATSVRNPVSGTLRP